MKVLKTMIYKTMIQHLNQSIKLELEDGSEYTLDDFFDEFEVDADFRSDFAFAAILKQKAERFDEMSDEEFFEFYENNRL